MLVMLSIFSSVASFPVLSVGGNAHDLSNCERLWGFMPSFKPWFRFLAAFSSVLFGFGQFCSSQAGPIVQFNRDHEPSLKRSNTGQLLSAEKFLGWKYAAVA